MDKLAVPVMLWLCVCVLARTDRQREVCSIGTLVLVALFLVLVAL